MVNMAGSWLDALTIPEIQKLTAPEVFGRGVQYYRQGAVEMMLGEPGELAAHVQGSQRAPYRVVVASGRPRELVWACNCPFAAQAEVPCKHVIAVLLASIERKPRRETPDPSPFQVAPAVPAAPPARGWVPNGAGSWRLPEAIAPFLNAGSWNGVRLDLCGTPDGPPRVELRFQVYGASDEGVLLLPSNTTPYALESLKCSGALWSDRARGLKVYRTPLMPELTAAYDDDGRLVLTPSFRHPSITGRAPGAEFAVVDRFWIWSDGAFFTVGSIPDPFQPYFKQASPTVLEGDAILRFLEQQAPQLAACRRYRPAPAVAASRLLPAPQLRGVSVRTATTDWLWLDPVYDAGGHELTLEELLPAARAGRPLRRGNDWIAVASGLAAGLEAAGGRVEAGRVTIPRLGYLRARAHWDKTVAVNRDDAVAEFEADLDRIRPAAPAVLPPGLKSALRPYQKTGYDWLWFLHVSGFHGVLADEMGLGKTHEAMALLLAAVHEDAVRPSLVVTPTSVLDHWEDKLREYAPALAPLRYHGTGRGTLAGRELAPVVLTTYALLARDPEVFRVVDWNYVILDEAQKIKNSSTQTARAIKALSARHRLALTGTPIENRLAELWSIFDFLLPGYLGSLPAFRREFETPIVRHGDRSCEAALKRAIHPFKLRRLKAEVLPELPPKMEEIRHCRLSPEQAVAYRALVDGDGRRLAEEIRGGGGPVPYIHIFSLLSRLKRLCDHPALVLRGPKGRGMTSGKFDLFTELMEEALDGGEKVVVFSQYLEMIDLIGAWLDQRGTRWVSLRGATRDRRAVVRAFQSDPDCRVFVGSLMAGGVGIDLTAGSVVIHYDRWWNAARENQATDRVHRIGQVRGVQVIKLVTRGTLEEKIDRMIRDKATLLDAVIEEDAATLKALSREELVELLTTSPLG